MNINENRKITLTLGQLRRLVKESVDPRIGLASKLLDKAEKGEIGWEEIARACIDNMNGEDLRQVLSSEFGMGKKDENPLHEGLVPGKTILYNHISWNCSYPHFFKVVGFAGQKSVVLQPLHSKVVKGDWQMGEVVAAENSPRGETFKARLTDRSGSAVATAGKFSRAGGNDYYIWDGQPLSQNMMD